MDKQEVNDSRSRSSRRLLPPLYPSSPTTTNVPRADNSSHHSHYSRFHPFQHNPASAAHSTSLQAGPGSKAGPSSYQQPPSLLSRGTHASAGVGGISNTVSLSQAIVSGSGCVAGSSSYQTPPSPQPQTHSSGANSGGVVDGGSAACFQMLPPLSPAPVPMDTNPMLGGGHATFFSSADTGLADVVGLSPLTCTQAPFSWSANQASSESGSPATPFTQGTASVDIGLTEEYVLPPLPPALSGPPPMHTATVANLEAVQYVDLEGPVGHYSNSSGRDWGNSSSSTKAPCPPPMQTATGVNLEAVQYVDLEGPGGHLNSSGRDWGSTSTKAPCPPLPHPYSSGYTCITQAPWSLLTLTPSSSMPAPGANFGVKKEAVDWNSCGTSQLGNNIISSQGSLSAWTPQPYSSGNTGSGITQAPWTPLTLTSSSSILAPAANAGVKKESVDWSGHTSQLGKNTITSGGSSSAWMPQPYSSGMVFGSKPNQLASPVVVDFAGGLFTQDDIAKIMADKDLANIVLEHPKKVRSLLRNRESAERSRHKSMMHKSDLERQVRQLQQENELLSAQVHSLQSKNNGLTAENNEMMIKLNGLEHETQLKNALSETLDAEVRRLKLIVGEIRDSHVSNSSYQEKSPQTIQPEYPKNHNHQLAQLQRDQELRELEDFIVQ